MTRYQEKWLVLLSPLVLALVVGALIVGVLRARAEDSRRWGSAALTGRDSSAGLPVSVISLGELAVPQMNDRYRGVVIASKEAELSFRRGGRVESIEVTEGATVLRGEVLATLDAADIEARIAVATAQLAESQSMLDELLAGPRKQTIDAAEADVRRLEATVALAQTTANRQQSLVAVNASSYQQYDDAKSALEQQHAALVAAEQRLSELREGTRKEQIEAQRSRVAAIQAQLQSLAVELSDSRIVAPFAGVIARRYLDDGVVVGPQTRAVRLLQLDPLEARFGLSTTDAASLRIGQAVTLTLGQIRRTAHVARIEPEIDLATRTQGVFVTISDLPPLTGQDNADSIRPPRGSVELGQTVIVPGQTVSLAIFADNQSEYSGAAADGSVQPGQETLEPLQLWVPLTALARAERGMWSLFVVVASPPSSVDSRLDSLANHRVSTQFVNPQVQYVIERREVHVIAVESGLARVNGSLVKAGDLIVSTALHRVTPGMKVEPVK